MAGVLTLAVLLALGGTARAENECGVPEPGVEIVCSPSTYDPAAGGNIFYGPDESIQGDLTIRLTGDLSIDYDRENPGDDFYIVPDDPDNPRYSAVWITPTETGYGYTGDISVFSSADVISNGRGLSVGHYGESGALRMLLTGGRFTTIGEGASALHNYHGGAGDVDLIARNVTVATNGLGAHGIISTHEDEGDLTIDVRGGAVTTMGVQADGIRAQYPGEKGHVNINVQGSTISTAGEAAHGIAFLHFGEGDAHAGVHDTVISTAGETAHGINSLHRGEGDVRTGVHDAVISMAGVRAYAIRSDHAGAGDIDVSAGRLTVHAEGPGSAAVFSFHYAEGDNTVSLRDVTMTLEGPESTGVLALHRGEGAITIDVQDGDLTVPGDRSNGVVGAHEGTGDLAINAHDLTVSTMGERAHAIWGHHAGTGDVGISAQNPTITAGTRSYNGILGQHVGTGDIGVEVQGGDITVMGTEADGIRGAHAGTGHLHIDVRDVTITSQSTELDPERGDTFSPGVYGSHEGAEGDITIGMTGGEIRTEGLGSHGIYATHESGMGEIRIAVDGGSIHAGGADAGGIRIGRLTEEGLVEGAAAVGGDGYRNQRVRVNGRVFGGSGEAAGVFLAGGGRVMVGPRGRLGAASGVAIRAAGAAPRLHVDVDLAGRRVASVVDGEIRSDGGATTLVVNGRTLYEDTKVATGLVIPNGAWDVTLRARTPIADRAFSANDVEEVYAPRAAVYEALPGLLLRLHSRGPAGERLSVPGSPAWVRVAGGGGRYTPVQAGVGARYDFRRIEVEAGLDVALGPRLTGTLSVRHVQGSGDVSSPTGGGEITARGLGGALGLAWQGPQGYYFRGRVSVMDYDVDLVSDARGTLTEDAAAVGHSLGFETGRRFTFSERLTLTPRVWVTRSKIDLGFTDAVQSRLWAEDSDRLTAGTGLVAGTERVWDGGAQGFAVRGALDLWRTLGDGTAVHVSEGAPLKSVSDKTRFLVSLGGVYRWGRFSVSSDVAAGGPGSRDQEYAGYLNLGIAF